jgi:uncharacterized oligopeptide transporter (OPT) family protein
MIVFCVINDLLGNKAALEAVINKFTGNALASGLVGIGCGSSAIVYTFERLRRRTQIAIHFAVGIGTYLPVSFGMGWLPSGSVGLAAGSALLCLAVFSVIWYGFYLYNKLEAKKINERLKNI